MRSVYILAAIVLLSATQVVAMPAPAPQPMDHQQPKKKPSMLHRMSMRLRRSATALDDPIVQPVAPKSPTTKKEEPVEPGSRAKRIFIQDDTDEKDSSESSPSRLTFSSNLPSSNINRNRNLPATVSSLEDPLQLESTLDEHMMTTSTQSGTDTTGVNDPLMQSAGNAGKRDPKKRASSQFLSFFSGSGRKLSKVNQANVQNPAAPAAKGAPEGLDLRNNFVDPHTAPGSIAAGRNAPKTPPGNDNARPSGGRTSLSIFTSFRKSLSAKNRNPPRAPKEPAVAQAPAPEEHPFAILKGKTKELDELFSHLAAVLLGSDLKEQGLFRVQGSLTAIQRLLDAYTPYLDALVEAGAFTPETAAGQSYDITHVDLVGEANPVPTMMKHIIGSLPAGALFTDETLDALIARLPAPASDSSASDAPAPKQDDAPVLAEDELTAIFEEYDVDDHIKHILGVSLRVMSEVAKLSSVNQMTPENLAISFGKKLFTHSAKREHSQMEDTPREKALALKLLENYQAGAYPTLFPLDYPIDPRGAVGPVVDPRGDIQGDAEEADDV